MSEFYEMKRQKDAIVKLDKAHVQRETIAAAFEVVKSKGWVKTEDEENEFIFAVMERLGPIEVVE